MGKHICPPSECSTCVYTLPEFMSFKTHRKTEFHQQNLKRKAFELKPFTLDEFATENQKNKDSFICEICSKEFSEKESYSQHLKTRKHVYNQMNQKENQFLIINDRPTSANKFECLYCLSQSQDFNNLLSHMQEIHGFIIPEERLCKDKIGLIKKLSLKINVGNQCLQCPPDISRQYKNSKAVRNHMKDSNHYQISQQTLEQCSCFYDYSKDENTNDSFCIMEDETSDQEFEIVRDFKEEKQVENSKDDIQKKMIGNIIINKLYKYKMIKQAIGSLKPKNIFGFKQENLLNLQENKKTDNLQKIEVSLMQNHQHQQKKLQISFKQNFSQVRNQCKINKLITRPLHYHPCLN